MSCANKDNYISSFPIGRVFISFSCLIALARTTSTMLYRSGESGHPCLVLDLRRKAFNRSPLRRMLAVGLSHLTFIMLRYVPSIPKLLRVFNHKRMLNFIESFLFLYWDAHMIFVFHSINVVYRTYWSVYVEPCLHPRDESHLIMVYELFNMLLNSVYCIFWEVLHLYSSEILAYSFLIFFLSGFGMNVMLAL